MDKNKLLSTQGTSKRAVKGMPRLPTNSSLYTLGTSSAPSSTTLQPSGQTSNNTSTAPASISGKAVSKREQNPPIPNAVAKKLKLLQASTVSSACSKSSGSSFAGSASSSSLSSSYGQHWEEKAVELDPCDLAKAVQDSLDVNKIQQATAFICGAVKQLRSARIKPDSALIVSLFHLAKSRPTLFQSDIIVDAFCSLLRKETSNGKLKCHPLCPMIAVNIMQAAFADEATWPTLFVKVWLEDSLGERVWVEQELCKSFVDNILTAFGTRMPSKHLLVDQPPSTGSTVSPAALGSTMVAGAAAKTDNTSVPASPSHMSSVGSLDDSSQDTSSKPAFSLSGSNQVAAAELRERLLSEPQQVQDRYGASGELLIEHLLAVIQEQLNRRQVPSEISKNLLRLMISTCGVAQVRAQAAQRLEIWLQNPKLGRTAQDLLAAVCLNCSEKDSDTFALLMRMRLKNKPLVNNFIASVREVISQDTRMVAVVLRCAISNELSQARSGNNMQLLAMLFQVQPTAANMALAAYLRQLLWKDDCLRSLRQLLRELVRALRHEHLNMATLAANLADSNDVTIENESIDTSVADRFCASIADLLILCMFLCVSPTVKEAFSANRNDSKREVLRNFYAQAADIQRIAIRWLHVGVQRLHNPDRNEYVHWLNKLLLMEGVEVYCGKDNWPPEQERALVFRLTMEIPVLEETLHRLLTIGFSKQHHVSPTEVIELIDTLIRRAAGLYDGEPAGTLRLQSDQVLQLLLKSAAYRPPENIALPANYEPPNMAIADWYWKVWLQLLVLVSHNCSNLGRLVAEGQYPMLNMLIEMVITNHFEYPPVSRANDDWRSSEQASAATEKQQILQFETHLAAASTKIQITESTSLLLSKLITFDPSGPPRPPPTAVLEQLRTLNQQLRLGHLLCQSRDPDFLLQIIQRHQAAPSSTSVSSSGGTGASNGSGQSSLTTSGQQSMPWLVELVEANADTYHQLPSQCLCEFVFGQFAEADEQGWLDPISTSASTNPFCNSSALVSQLTVNGTTVSHCSVATNQLSIQERTRRKEKRRKLVKLVTHLQHLMKSNLKSGEQLLSYFFKRLSFPQAGFRALAVRVLGVLFTYSGTGSTSLSSSSLEEDGGWPFPTLTPCAVWLIEKTPQLPFFAQLQTMICECLQDAVLVEALPQLVCGYIQFLSIHESKPDRSLARSMARLLIERPIMTKCLIQGEFREPFLSACAKLFYQHISQSIQAGTGPSVLESLQKCTTSTTSQTSGTEEESKDWLVLRWPHGEGILGTRVAHAIMLLLSFGPSRDERLLYEELLQLWFEPTPEALTLNGEPCYQALVPDWLKLRLIRSTVPSLVDCALRDLQVHQLLLFIQTFGIPIISMEKLLSALDSTCKHDPEAVRSCIGNVNLIKQLIEVQFSRGVKSGYRFAELIGIN